MDLSKLPTYFFGPPVLCVVMGMILIFPSGNAQAQLGVDDNLTPTRSGTKRNAEWLKSEMGEVPSFWRSKWLLLAEKTASGQQVEDRQELTAASQRLLQKYRQSGGLYRDPVAKEHLQRVLLRVHPQLTIPGWGGSLQVQVLQSSLPNAMALYDGTILVSTGLVAQLRSVDELSAVVAHEVAHLAEDHSFESYSSKKGRKNLAKVLGGIAGIAAGAALGTAASEGGATVRESAAIASGVAVTTVLLSENIAEVVGAKYDRNQEEEADRLAQRWLMESSAQKEALASALHRIEKEAVMRGRASENSFLSTHPGYKDRLEVLSEVAEEQGKGISFPAEGLVEPSSSYDQKFASLLQRDAEIRVLNGRYEEAIALLDRVLEAGAATPDTYFLKAVSLRHAYNEKEDNREASRLLSEYVDEGGEQNARYFMEVGIINMRLQNTQDAIKAFQDCAETLRDAEEPTRVRLREQAKSAARRLEGTKTNDGKRVTGERE